MRRLIPFLFLTLFHAATAQAQAATVVYTLPAGATVAQGQAWQPVLYLNNVATPLATVWTCAVVGAGVDCSYTLPDISKQVGPTNTFELALRDAVVGEGPRSAPLSRPRPGAPINLRFP